MTFSWLLAVMISLKMLGYLSSKHFVGFTNVLASGINVFQVIYLYRFSHLFSFIYLYIYIDLYIFIHL